MSADELRQAAATLRERANKVRTSLPWSSDVRDDGRAWLVTDDGLDRHGVHGHPHAAHYIATVHPGVGLALADWLDAEAAIYERLEAISMEVTPKGYTLSWPESTQAEAEALARLINGGAA